MIDWLAANYAWVKALHVISVIAWMAGMLYLPRLFVYHAQVPAGSDRSEMLKVMERRLLRAIVNPAMLASFLFGGLMLLVPGVLAQGWLHAKFALLAGMLVVHHLLARWRKDFAADRNRRSHRFYRVWNEVPTVLLIAIVLLAVVKPF